MENNIEFKVTIRWWFKFVVYAFVMLNRTPPDWLYTRGLKIVQVKNKNKHEDDKCNA